MNEDFTNLMHGGFTVVRNFFSADDLARVRDEYERAVSASPSNANYNVQLGSAGLNRHFEPVLDAVSHQVCADAGIHADVTAGSIFFSTKKGVNFPWHQDHESYFLFQDHYNYLNFYIPFIKEKADASNLCLIPFDRLKKEAPDHIEKLIGGGAKRFQADGDCTTVLDDEYDTAYSMPVNLERIAVAPELNAGDLLLFRGDMIHRTQDSTSNRVAISFRKVNSRSIINRHRISSGGKTKREMMKKGGGIYDVAIRYFETQNLDEATAMDLLPHLHLNLYSQSNHGGTN
ncbi:MAG TPA: phytanoyl-CoA dioxygenase family protein [Bradyrhizobium sp.]|nr:phytanoyl-CoA dioxygenase family protein [Bradyrhizobium sp.]